MITRRAMIAGGAAPALVRPAIGLALGTQEPAPAVTALLARMTM